MKKHVWSIFAGVLALVAASAMILATPGQEASEGFSMSAFPSTAITWPAGPPAEYQVSLSSIGGYSGKVALKCSSSSREVSCSVSPSSVEINPELAVAVRVTAAAGPRAQGAAYLTITGNGDTSSTSTTVTLLLAATDQQ